jgi:hypothetical protein
MGFSLYNTVLVSYCLIRNISLIFIFTVTNLKNFMEYSCVLNSLYTFLLLKLIIF